MNQSGRFLLDTNIVIAIFADEVVVQERRRNVEKVFIPSPVIGELYFGARKSDRSTENLAKINEIVQQIRIIPCNLGTAQWYGIIKDQLRRKGCLIPDNDIWIAAIAMQHGLILVTRDAHFDEVESLQTEYW